MRKAQELYAHRQGIIGLKIRQKENDKRDAAQHLFLSVRSIFDCCALVSLFKTAVPDRI